MNKTTFMRVYKQKKTFSIVASDRRLSATAIGVMCYLINQKDTWIINKSIMHKILLLGKRRFIDAWNELVHYGYIEETSGVLPSGKKYFYVVNEDPDEILS